MKSSTETRIRVKGQKVIGGIDLAAGEDKAAMLMFFTCPCGAANACEWLPYYGLRFKLEALCGTCGCCCDYEMNLTSKI